MRIHLGCGKRRLEGYVHVDLADYPHIDYKHDVKSLPMFGDGSAGLIYASHVIEYFDRLELEEVLKEWRRVLRRGGILRLAVPDFRALAWVYMRHGDINLVLGPLCGRWPVPGAGMTVYHKTVFDYASLKAMLESAGFRNVRRWDWRKVFTGRLAGFDDYIPHMDKERGRLISLNLEAEK
jgi:predicted SAM-dependent methyltransferase